MPGDQSAPEHLRRNAIHSLAWEATAISAKTLAGPQANLSQLTMNPWIEKRLLEICRPEETASMRKLIATIECNERFREHLLEQNALQFLKQHELLGSHL